ncbi:nectin-3-like protein [Syngnathus acus]|uniref:nectin-3-like protein n=1 Tax=Syngnathus acus TaxID=161584 RepID=UPI00188625A6|nr:nectin-3-like protein [Syngnathus acus]
MSSTLRRSPAHGAMEPLYRLLATLLVVYGPAGVGGDLVLAPEKVDAVLGKRITLGCHIKLVPNITLIQSSWERQIASGREVLAVYHVDHGTYVHPEFAARVAFVSTTNRAVNISLSGVTLEDGGAYTCKVSTFPLGNGQATTQLNVLVEPKAYVSAGPDTLLEGEAESLVATCVAERGLPAAEVSWETELSGRVETRRRDEADGTASVHLRYLWTPGSAAQGKNLTCVVRHPTLETDFRIVYVLNVHFAPTVRMEGDEQNWYAGQANVTLSCNARANPPVREYRWARLDGPMPERVAVTSNRLAFTRPLTLNDSGVYRCQATNDIGAGSRDVSLWVQEPPSTTAATATTSPPGGGAAAGTARSPLTSPTLAPVQDNETLGLVAGGVAGGALVLILAVLAVCFSLLRKRRTFRGDYYTKQYLGPSDVQKETQVDVLQPHELHEVYGDKGSQEFKSKLCGDVICDGWAEPDRAYRPDGYQQTQHPHGLSNGSPYLPGGDGDYVAHQDGSVISRREWYV